MDATRTLHEVQATPNLPSSISEKFSEKTKRGRPKKLMLQRLFPIGDAKTVRGKQNYKYLLRAMVTLDHDSRFYWICDSRENLNNGGGTFKMTILSELGRVEDDDLLLDLASEICEKKLATKEAVNWIRNGRGVRKGEPSKRVLLCELARCIDDYRFRYPKTTDGQVKAVVLLLMEVVDA